MANAFVVVFGSEGFRFLPPLRFQVLGEIFFFSAWVIDGDFLFVWLVWLFVFFFLVLFRFVISAGNYYVPREMRVQFTRCFASRICEIFFVGTGFLHLL